jgi:hypothetical protein
VEINGAIRDVLKQTRDEVTKNGVSVLTLRRALADCPSRSGATTASNPQFDYQRRGGSERHARRITHPSPFVRHTARPACRRGILDNPAMNRLEMPFGDGALAVAY